MINLFLDTNVYLSFYSYTNSDLEWLNALLWLIDEWDIQVLIPTQIIDEYKRNREWKIAKALHTFSKVSLSLAIPKICDSYEEKDEINNLLGQVKNKKIALIQKIRDNEKSKTLKADLLIKQIFEKWIHLNLTDEIYYSWIKRLNLWNPPGKNWSYWDAIVRESFLRYDFEYNNFHFVSLDSDYACSLYNKNLKWFLFDEWESKKSDIEIFFYNDFNNFFEENNLPLQIDDEYRKAKLVRSLIDSWSFNTSRTKFEKLIKYEISDFSDNQALEIILSSLNNNQIYMAHWYNASNRMWDRLVSLIQVKWWDLDNEIIDDFNAKFGYSLEHNLPF